jgi:class 3 adenylate cyclase
MMNIGGWLQSLGLARYEPAFRENDIDPEILPSLTADDLIGLGVTSIGHRRRLLDAIAALRARATTDRDDPGPTPPPPRDLGAERRQLTVMFCDLVGSTALSSQLDPEDLREVIGAYHHCVADTIGRFDGFVAKYMGDGVLVYFGYPRAQENDAERAILAALEVVGAVAALRPRSTGELACRVGIATGLVVVGDLVVSGEAQQRGVVGETPNLATRLQSLAELGAVLISGETRRLVGDLFEYRDLGAVAIRGTPEPVPLWQVLRPSAIESRFEALRMASLSPLIGREEEIDLLLRRWSRSKDGEGQTVLLSGEPGIGKSRIIAALQERLHGEPHTRLRYFCSPHRRDSPLHPFTAQLERAAGFARDDAPAIKLDKLEKLLAQSDENPSGAAALIADLLAIPTDGRYLPLPPEPERRRQQILASLVGQLDGLARVRPVLLMFEDAHWADSTSLELLDLIIDRLRRLPVLVVVTFRPEFSPPWVGQAQVAVLALSRLGSRDAARLADAVGGGPGLPPEVLDRIVGRTDGVPLFVEELTKTVLESGVLREDDGRWVVDRPFLELAIPSSLHDSLMARLDRLAPIKEVAQTGAVIGREFSCELLATLLSLSEGDLLAALDQLVMSELVFRRGIPPAATYIFKHALIQDAAYSSLLRSRRRELHARVAELLQERMPERTETEPELLAHHYTEAGLAAQAIDYWLRAGRRSAERSANVEAVGHLNRGLEVLRTLPETVERARQELALQVALAGPLIASKGYAATEAAAAASRARELCEQLGDADRLPQVLYAELGMLYVAAEDLRRVWPVVERFATVTGGLPGSGAQLVGRRFVALRYFHRGEFRQLRDQVRETLELFDPTRHGAIAWQYGHDEVICERGYLSWALWLLGFPDQAMEWGRAAAAHAAEIQHANSKALALCHGLAMPQQFLRNAVAVREHSESLLEYCNEMKLPLWHAFGEILAGW